MKQNASEFTAHRVTVLPARRLGKSTAYRNSDAFRKLGRDRPSFAPLPAAGLPRTIPIEQATQQVLARLGGDFGHSDTEAAIRAACGRLRPFSMRPRRWVVVHTTTPASR